MSLFKRKKKEDPKRGQKILTKIVESVKEGEPNEQIEYMQKVLKKSYAVPPKENPFEDKKLGDINDYVKFMKEAQEKHDADRKKQLAEMKKQNKFYYRMKRKISAKYADFKSNMEEIGAFIRHEFHSMRKLVFLINDLFFGPYHKNRKLFYNYKDKYIKHNGYARGEVKFNNMIRRLTKSAEINKRILNGRYG